MERSDVRDFRDTDRSRISLRSIRATHFAVPLRQTRKGLSISIKLREERLGRKQSHDTIADRDFARPHALRSRPVEPAGARSGDENTTLGGGSDRTPDL